MELPPKSILDWSQIYIAGQFFKKILLDRFVILEAITLGVIMSNIIGFQLRMEIGGFFI
jgi:hypothetical protein